VNRAIARTGAGPNGSSWRPGGPAFAFLIFAWAFSPHVAAAQQPAMNSREVRSDLADQNQSRVSASAEEVKSILLRDAGLLVELKRQVAREATNRGQIISDADLADDAIFERLETDFRFRALATALVQRYGYLVPKPNPASYQARQYEILIEERARRMAAREDQELADARRGNENAPPSQASPETQPGAEGPPEPGRTEPAKEPAPRNPLNPPDIAAPPLRRGSGPGDGSPESSLERTDASEADGSLWTLPGVRNVSVNLADPADPLAPSAPFGQPTLSPPVEGRRTSEPAVPQDTFDVYANESAVPVLKEPIRESKSPKPAPPVEMVRQRTPYADIPALYDMYVQAVARPAAPRRFGFEVFENSARNPQLIPMDLPAGPEYVVGPGDALAVDLWGSVSERLYRIVDREGRVSLPEIGPILVSGKSLAAVQQSVQQVLRTQLRDVSADVSLARLRTVRIYEVGEVAHPGAYDVSSLSTPLNALFSAGGPTERGSMRQLKHFRGAQLLETVDLYDLLLHGVKSDLQRLENGDTVQVPPAGPEVTIEGMVRRPAVYELRDEKTLSQVVELAGGLLPIAVLRHIEVQRTVEHAKETMLSVDVPDAATPMDVSRVFDAFEVRDGDRIRIYPIAPYNQDSVFLDGHALRPGRYAFHPGMRVTDVVSSYQDLLPEPSVQYAEIIHIDPPDFHPVVEGFDLSNALADPGRAPELRAMDTIRIFGRFDFEDPPSVSVLGDVRAPGTYRTSGVAHLADAIHLAKGLTADARTADAQVFRHLPNGEFKIFSVGLDRALAGDPSENIVLDPRDRILVHKNPDSVEPAAVYVEGEVANPGRYPLTTNMRVADLVRVGGGLKPSADAETADLTHYAWSAQSKLGAGQERIALSAALANDPGSNLPVHNGDVLTVRQLSGWNDLGASIALKGEVRHPGTYGLRPGERLSSVLLRAGGFEPGAYPYGAVLQRPQVREMESKAQGEILNRLRDAQTSLELLPETDSKQKQAKAMAVEQAQASIEQLSASPVVGRVTIRISSEIGRWKNTAADLEVRAGDTLTIPKRPGWVMVTGQVYTPTAVSFRPGRSAKWYLAQSGGPTQMGNKGAIFVIRADGSVVGARHSLITGESLSAALQPGDTVVVPERAIAGGVQWQSVLLSAQAASAIASTVFIALRY
jgi:polysaccharide biosynthesis/export protein